MSALVVIRAAGLSTKSLHDRLNLLHGIFGFGVKRGWCVENPMARVDRPRQRGSNGRRRYLEREQLESSRPCPPMSSGQSSGPSTCAPR
jgi:site-specific recombinase XerC